MKFRLPASVTAQFARAASMAPKFKYPVGPIRLTIVSAVLLSLVVVSGGGLFLFSLHSRVRDLDERNLSNIALVLSKQIEQIFTAVTVVQTRIIEDTAALRTATTDTSEDLLSGHDVYLALRDKAAGMPYVGSLSIFNAQGRLLNFSRQWPTPAIDAADREFFKTLQSNPSLTSFTSEPVRSRATGNWIIHLARKIPGPNGELLGMISAAIELEYLQKYFSEISLEPGSSVVLFREDGMLLTRFPAIDPVVGRRFIFADALKLVSTTQKGVGVVTGVVDGQARMVAAHRIGGFPNVIATTKTQTAIYAGWWQTVGYVISISALTIVAIAAFTFLFIRMFWNYQALAQARAERQKAEQLQQQSLVFDVALNNLSQGVIMFDGSKQIILCNQRYVDMYGLPPEAVTPGHTLREILHIRQTLGTFSRDIEEYRREILNLLASGKTRSAITTNPTGRSYRVINVPMAGGGWVATHEDVTEKVNAEKLNEQQKLHLDAALENMSQGLCMFDAAQRLIVCNKQYANLYGLSPEQTKPGTSIRAILQHRIAVGNAPEDHENYLKERLNEVTINQPYQITNRLRDGRFVSIVHRPMAGGGWVATHEDVTEAKRREDSFRLLFDGNPIPMWVMDRDSLRFLAVNEAAMAHYGYSREQFMSMRVSDLRPADDRACFEAFLRALPDGQMAANFGQHIKSDGTPIDLAAYSRSLIYGGHPARLTVIHDITQAKLAEDELRRTRKFLDTVIEHVPIPIVVKSVPNGTTDARDCLFELVNRAYEQLADTTQAQLHGKTAHESHLKEHADTIVATDQDALQSHELVLTHEQNIVTPHNGTRIVTSKKTAIRDKNGKPQYLLAVLDDVTERRRAEERIAYLAHTDSLTDLPNRATFVEALAVTLDAASKGGSQFAILCIDLDRFKEANDVYGHLVGDGLLREVAGRLRAVAGDVFLARVGGDEFTLIVTGNAQPATAAALGHRLLDAFQDEFIVDSHRMQLGLSIGGAVYPNDGDDAETLMGNADAALYQAKAEGRGSLRFFEPELGARLHQRRELLKDLQLAVKRNEFFLHYQPQFKIASGEAIGFETLVRWQCPKRGLVSPEKFIPIAEESSLIIPLGEWILREACREAASWPHPLTIAVNISPVQFHHGDLPRLVHSILLETGLAPGRLELEITEGVLIDDFSRAVSILRKLKSLGVHISMDDFGSGYSSLSYLHSFPFDKIKIDRSFIGDLEHNHHSMAIARAIITLGHSLDVPILGEGVETEAQRLFLAQEGCDEVQGFLTGRPHPIADYAQLVGRAIKAKRKTH